MNLNFRNWKEWIVNEMQKNRSGPEERHIDDADIEIIYQRVGNTLTNVLRSIWRFPAKILPPDQNKCKNTVF